MKIDALLTVFVLILTVCFFISEHQLKHKTPCSVPQLHSVIEKAESCKKEIALLKQWDCIDQKIREVCR